MQIRVTNKKQAEMSLKSVESLRGEIATRGRKLKKVVMEREEIADMVDIVCNSEYYKKKITFTNSKNSKNNDVYSKLQKDLQERVSARGQELQFTAAQVRNKLKKLISECKKAALTVKTATGIDRFQEQKNYGSWFPMLFSLVKT